MKLNKNAICIAFLGTVGLAATVQAADRSNFDFGKREYMSKCAVCHGQSGKGDGGVTELLKVAPSDLTTLSKKNGGVFPYDRVYRIIDGRDVVKGHGTRDMPIWGMDYAGEGVAAAEHYVDVPYNMEMYVRNRILSLIDYLNRIQAKS